MQGNGGGDPQCLKWGQVFNLPMKGSGVITTAHRPSGLPVLARCESSSATVAAIVERLPAHGGAIGSVDIEAAFRHHGGNVRDALAALYDRFEERRPSRATTEP